MAPRNLLAQLDIPDLTLTSAGSLALQEQFRLISESSNLLHRIVPMMGVQEQLAGLHFKFHIQAPDLSGFVEQNLRPLDRVVRQAQEQMARHMAEVGRISAGNRLQDMVGNLAFQANEALRFNVDLRYLAQEAWSADQFRKRTALITDSVRNALALHSLSNTTLVRRVTSVANPRRFEVGRSFVARHGAFIRRLPPAIDTGDGNSLEAEEIGGKLHLRLAEIDPRLVELRRGAWEQLRRGVPGARIGMLALRELLMEVLHRLAPDEVLFASEIWRNRSDRKLTKPTRYMRIEFLLGTEAAAELDALLQFDASVRRANKFAHTFAENSEVVRAFMAQIETWIYLVLVYREGE